MSFPDQDDFDKIGKEGISIAEKAFNVFDREIVKKAVTSKPRWYKGSKESGNETIVSDNGPFKTEVKCSSDRKLGEGKVRLTRRFSQPEEVEDDTIVSISLIAYGDGRVSYVINMHDRGKIACDAAGNDKDYKLSNHIYDVEKIRELFVTGEPTRVKTLVTK